MRAAGLLVLLALCTCGEEARSTACLTRVAVAPDGTFARLERLDDGRLRLTYEDGVVLDVPRRPRRIISTAPGLTETIAHLQGLDHLVGVTEWCNHPPGVERLPRITVIPLDLEGIIARTPDLVVADRTLHRSSVDPLRRRFPGALLLLETSRSLAHYEHSLAILTEVLDDARSRRRGAAWVGALGELRTELAGRLARAPGRAPRVLVVSQWEPLYVEGPGGLMHDMLRACGCVNLACDLGRASDTFSEELVFQRRPEVILHREGPPPARLRRRWSHIPAVREGRLGSCASDAFSRGGPRILGALRTLFSVLRDAAPMSALAEVR